MVVTLVNGCYASVEKSVVHTYDASCCLIAETLLLKSKKHIVLMLVLGV